MFKNDSDDDDDDEVDEKEERRGRFARRKNARPKGEHETPMKFSKGCRRTKVSNLQWDDYEDIEDLLDDES